MGSTIGTAANGTSKERKKNDDHGCEDPRANDDQQQLLPITHTVLGVKETDLVAMTDPHERHTRFVREDRHCFVHVETGALTPYGDFYTPTIASLRQRVAALRVPADKQQQQPSNHPQQQQQLGGHPHNNIVSLTTRSGVDIGALQGSLTTADRAMVQVASNFNCLENPSRHTRLNSGYMVDVAHMDCTQGPAAVFGTTSAYLYRCHFYQGGQSIVGPGQTAAVNLLQHTRAYFGTPRNGKLTLTTNDDEIVLLQTEAQIDEAAAQVCIGLHQDCPIMFGRTTEDVVYNEPEKVRCSSHRSFGIGGLTEDTSTGGNDGPLLLEYPLVDHVLNASINLHDFGTLPHQFHHNDDTAVHLANLTRALLRAAYEGVYLAALLRRRRTLYLTLVGGGCFGNDIGMIVSEIQRAHALYAHHPASVLEECVICLYSHHDEISVRDAMERDYQSSSN